MFKAPPRTLLEVYESLPEGTLAELVNNQLLMEPAPDFYHQDIVTEIARLLSNHVIENGLGKVVVSPVDVYFDKENVFQPDVIFIAAGRLPSLIQKGRVHGAPDLIIDEVLSPGTEGKEKRTKKPVYEKHGVQEYWLVSPTTKKVIGFQLVNGRYQEFFNGTGIFTSALLNTTIKF